MSNITPIFSFNDKLFNDHNLVADVSAVKDISEVIGFAVQSVWTGTLAGNIIVQVSNDNVNFFQLDSQAMGGAAGNDMYEVPRTHAKYARVLLDYTSGTGTITVTISGKRV